MNGDSMISIAQYTIVDLSDPIQQGTAPSNPIDGMLWMDTSASPPVLKRYNGTDWEEVGDFETGGRNLLMPTKDEFSFSTATSDQYDLTDYAKTLKQTDSFCISFEAKASTDMYLDWYFRTESASEYPSTTSDAFHLTTEYAKYTCAITPHADLSRYAGIRVRQNASSHGSAARIGTVYLRNVMLERGTKATSHTLAPEEVQANVDAARSAADSAQASIDGLEIGGRNILIGSATALPKAYSGATLNIAANTTVAEWNASDAIRVYGTGGTSTTVATYTGSVTKKSQNQQQYVGSIYIKNNSSDELMIYPNGIGTEKTVAGGTSTRVVIDDIVGDGSHNLQFSFRTATAGETFDFVFWHPKIEIGNRATDWTPAPEDVDTSILEAEELARQALSQTELIVGTQTAVTGAWTGVASFPALVDGQQISYWLPYDGSGNATLNLTLPNGTKTGAIACYYSGSTRITTHYKAGNVIHLTYRKNAIISGGTTTYTGWWADANYDTNTYDRIRMNNSINAKTAITAGYIIVGNDSG